MSSLPLLPGMEGESPCTCKGWADDEVTHRIRCRYHSFRDHAVARQFGVEYDRDWVALRIRREQEDA